MPLEFRFILYLYFLFLFCITLNLKDFCEARGTKIYAFSVYKICKKKKKTFSLPVFYIIPQCNNKLITLM